MNVTSSRVDAESKECGECLQKRRDHRESEVMTSQIKGARGHLPAGCSPTSFLSA